MCSYGKDRISIEVENDNKKNIEENIIDYIKMGKEKVENEFGSTKKAIEMMAIEASNDFINSLDKPLTNDNIKSLRTIIKTNMLKSFCYGYAIGKIEEEKEIELFI